VPLGQLAGENEDGEEEEPAEAPKKKRPGRPAGRKDGAS
jgi:hypothetical protein